MAASFLLLPQTFKLFVKCKCFSISYMYVQRYLKKNVARERILYNFFPRRLCNQLKEEENSSFPFTLIRDNVFMISVDNWPNIDYKTINFVVNLQGKWKFQSKKPQARGILNIEKACLTVFRRITCSQHFYYRWRKTFSLNKFVIEFSAKQHNALKTRYVKKKQLINSTVLRTSRITSCKTAFRLHGKRPLVISTKAIFNMSG